MATILHLVAETDWLQIPPTASTYSPPSLAVEGFVHCTADDAVLLQVANAFYRSHSGGFLVLALDEDRLTGEVRREPGRPAPPPGQDAVLFPHVYGPLDLGAIVEVRRAVRSDDGTFVAFAAQDASS